MAVGWFAARSRDRSSRVARWRRVRSALFDLLVAGAVALASFVPLFSSERIPLTGLIGLGMAIALLGRRRWPLSVLTVISLLGLVQVLALSARHDPQPYDIAVLIAMYSVVKYGRALWHGFLAAVPVTAGVVIEVARHAGEAVAARADPVRYWTETLGFLGAFCAAVWLAGFIVRTRRLYVAGLEARALTAERERDHLALIAVANERAAIARELHDVVAHSLAVMIVQADGATYALDGEPAQAKVAMKQVASTGRDALADMRRLVGVLRGTASDPADPADPAGVAAEDRRRVGLDQLDALVERACSAGLAVDVTAEGERPAMPSAVELTAYRIIQEALTNVFRHAGTSARVSLCLGYGPKAVSVEVTDDGAGRLAEEPSRSGGHGLIGMRERVAVHGGQFEAGPRLGGGWRVAVQLPWP
jgi:signal transduction histidine kinase